MNRRQYLLRTGAGAAAAALAGCLGSLTDGDAGAAVEDRTGERELSRAAGALNEAALALDRGDVDDLEAIEFDPAEPNERIEAARDHLATAETELGADRKSDIETLRSYADVLEGLVTVTETLTDEGLESDAEAVFDATGGDGDLAAATETLDERLAAFDAAEARYADAADAFEALDGDRFEAVARIEPATLEDGIETLGNALDSLTTLGSGLDSLLEGYDALERGQERIDDGEYESAETAFTDAESSFETAESTLESDEEPPSGLEPHVQTARCQSGHLADAAAAFADAAAAMAARDFVTADRRQREGERALEDAEDCAN